MSPQLFSTLKWTIFFYISLLFFYNSFVLIDPDLGWHLSAGEIVATNSWTPPTTDPWNYTLLNYKWVDHEWLIDGIFYVFWENGYWYIIEIFFSLIVLVPILIWWIRLKNSLSLLLAFLAAGLILEMSGVRPQIISILLFYVLYEVLFSENKTIKKLIIFAPLLFWIWSNLHAGFPAGFVLWGGSIVFSLISFLNKKNELLNSEFWPTIRIEVLLFSLSIFATLFNPYHIDLWVEILKSTFTHMNKYIAEWSSPLNEINFLYTIFASFSIVFIFSLRGILPKKQIFISFIFLIIFLRHSRMLPFFLISVIPLINDCTEITMSQINKYYPIIRKVRTRTFIDYVALISIIILFYLFTMQDFIETPYNPPKQAISILQSLKNENIIEGNTYNTYDFGGWLIFSDPKRKVFIDGRSPHWRDEAGFSPFESQIQIEQEGKDYKSTFDKFNIQSIIINSNQISRDLNHTTELKTDADKLSKIIMDIRNSINTENQMSFTSRLKNDGWCIIYKDSKAVLLVMPQNKICSAHNINTK